LPSTTIAVPAAAAPASAAGTSAPRAGPIAGGVVGGLAALAALGAAAVWYLRRRRRRKPEGRYDLAEGAAAHEIKPFYGYEGASASVVGQVREAAPAAVGYAVPVVGYAVPAVGYAVPAVGYAVPAVGYAGAQHGYGAYEPAGQPSDAEPPRGSGAAPAPPSAAEEKRRLRLASSASGGGHASRPSSGVQSPLAPVSGAPLPDSAVPQAGGAPLGDALEVPPPEYRRAPW
ncbi:hypothetical protein HDZ31DRAFT_78113, partial [Schizophyllum fasciatum]